MRDITTVMGELERLRALRASGRQSIKEGDRALSYRSDIDIAAAIAALESELASLTGEPLRAPARRFYA